MKTKIIALLNDVHHLDFMSLQSFSTHSFLSLHVDPQAIMVNNVKNAKRLIWPDRQGIFIETLSLPLPPRSLSLSHPLSPPPSSLSLYLSLSLPLSLYVTNTR